MRPLRPIIGWWIKISADNYIYVGKTDGGKYAVSHRSASAHYSDEVDESPREYDSLVGTSKDGALQVRVKVPFGLRQWTRLLSRLRFALIG